MQDRRERQGGSAWLSGTRPTVRPAPSLCKCSASAHKSFTSAFACKRHTRTQAQTFVSPKPRTRLVRAVACSKLLGAVVEGSTWPASARALSIGAASRPPTNPPSRPKGPRSKCRSCLLRNAGCGAGLWRQPQPPRAALETPGSGSTAPCGAEALPDPGVFKSLSQTDLADSAAAARRRRHARPPEAATPLKTRCPAATPLAQPTRRWWATATPTAMCTWPPQSSSRTARAATAARA